jgi:protein-S-isoprenylcysteine O-methyltransferase Ste14
MIAWVVRSLLVLYVLHGLFWSIFVVRRLLGRRAAPPPSATALRTEAPRSAPHARLFVHLHGIALGVIYFGVGALYFGVGHRVLGRLAELLFRPQPIVGGVLIVAAGALAIWSLMAFRSWKLEAELDAGHELATGGPFAFVRHPLYVSFNLVALGTWVWAPTAIVLGGTLLVFLGSYARARVEEKLLVEAFGDRYRAYMRKTRRFIPFVY